LNSEEITTENPASPLPPADIAQPFTEMADPYAAHETEPEIFHSDHTGLQDAARELSERRSALEEPLIPREYRRVTDGELSPANEFVSAERASDDLARIRTQEAEAPAELKNAEVRMADELRG